MTILEKIKFEEDWLSEVSLTKENIKIALEGIRATVLEQQQQPCEDCISREEALKAMCDKCPMYNCVTRCSSYRHIEKMPSVTPQSKRGKWIDYYKEMPIFNAGGFTETKHVGWTCSCCGENNVWIKSDYCPNCGSYNGGKKDV